MWLLFLVTPAVVVGFLTTTTVTRLGGGRFSQKNDRMRPVNLVTNLAEEVASLIEARGTAGLEAKHLKSIAADDAKGAQERAQSLDLELAELVWLNVDAQSQGGDNLTTSWYAQNVDFGGRILDKYCEVNRCSHRKAPTALVAAAAATAAFAGDDQLAASRLLCAVTAKASGEPKPQRLGSSMRSKLVAAFCAAPGGREDAFLDLAVLGLLDLEDNGMIGANAWLSQRGRRSVLDAFVRRARTQSRRRLKDDDETALLSSVQRPAIPCTNAPTRIGFAFDDDELDSFEGLVDPESRRLSDMLPPDEEPSLSEFAGKRLNTYRKLVVAAENLARGAPRGRGKREALARVAALAYHAAQAHQLSALAAVRAALKRASDGEHAQSSAAAAVLRAVLREALGQGDAASVSKLLDELNRREAARSIKEHHIGFTTTVEDDDDAYDSATLDVVLAAAADDGDAQGAALAFAARSAKQDSSTTTGTGYGDPTMTIKWMTMNETTAKHDRALGLAIRACVLDVAAGGQVGDVTAPLFSKLGTSYIEALAEVETSRSRDVRLARIELLAAAHLAAKDADAVWRLVDAGRGRDGPRALKAALSACEAVAGAQDPDTIPNDDASSQEQQQPGFFAARVAYHLVRKFFSPPPNDNDNGNDDGDTNPLLSASITDAVMRVFAAAGATRLAFDVARGRPDDKNARYGALRCCALSARPDAVGNLLNHLDITTQQPVEEFSLGSGDRSARRKERNGPWTRLAVVVAHARAGNPDPAVAEWRRLNADFTDNSWIIKKAVSAVVAALVSHPRGAKPAARLVESIALKGLDAISDGDEMTSQRGDDTAFFAAAFGVKPPEKKKKKRKDEASYDDDGRRVRSALARRIGNARNWAALSRSKGPQVTTVSETTYARLAAALIRSREARDAADSLRLLARYGVVFEPSLQSYLDIVEPRQPGSGLYKALFGTSRRRRSDPSYSAQAERWYDSRPDRARPQLDPKRDRKHARDVVAAQATADGPSPEATIRQQYTS